jgi:nicotinamide-nucleotide amidase
MPGVPHEMRIAMTEQVIPYLRDEREQIIHRTLMLYGIAESTLAILIEDWENKLPATMHLAYLPKDGVIRLRVSSYGGASDIEVDAQIDILKSLVSDYLIATEDLALEVILGQLLKDSRQTIATAESCTGGRLAAALNAQSGASAYYMGSVVAYDNRIKQQVIGVQCSTLEKYGAVSELTVREMAEGVRALMQTDYAIATSGIAGPTGGTQDKPVGTVWIAWATPDGTMAECFKFGVAREREQITQRAVTTALVKMIKILQAK